MRVALAGDRAIRRALRDDRPDIVWCATEFRLGHLGRRAARAAGVPVVSSYHTDFEQYAKAYGTGAIGRPVREWLAAFHRRTALVLAPSQSAIDGLAAVGVPGAELWGRCVDTTRFHPGLRDEAWRHRHGLVGPTTLLVVSRLAPEKRVDLVLEAFGRARSLLPSHALRLLVVGDGPLERTLHAQARRILGTDGSALDEIRLLGGRDRDRELPRLYANADAYVFASTTETLGLVVLEAMASGLPVAAPAVGGVRDHLRDGVNGLDAGRDIVDGLARAMVRFAMEPGWRAALGAAARATAEAVDEARELDWLDARLRALAGGGRRRVAA
ncbi:MAG: glycosyltransferase [Gemmatimonadaceae bacterium]|nr:glycosyltransferase [Gemmatimonadaceae bacterium]